MSAAALGLIALVGLGLGPSFPFEPVGVVYSRYRKAFYIWHFSCGFDPPPPVPADAIMRAGWTVRSRDILERPWRCRFSNPPVPLKFARAR